MEKLKVLQVIKSLGRGGAETLLVETLKEHDKDQFEFHYVYFLPWKNQLVKDLEAEGGRVTCLDAGNNISLLAKTYKLAHYVREHKIDLIHAHLPWAGVAARIAGIWTGVPVVYSEHNKQERYHALTRWLNLATMELTTRIIAVSDDVAQSIVSFRPGVKRKVVTLLNGVNVNHFLRSSADAHSLRRSLSIPESALVVGTVAVFRVQKRLDLWIEIASRVAGTNGNVHFLIVGDGPLKSLLQERIETLGIGKIVHLPGLQTDVRPYLAAMDVYLMSSKFEGLPIALLEAMAMECPVVTTTAGGIKEVVREEIEGLTSEVDDIAGLTRQTKRVLEDQNLRQRLGKAARTRILDRFTMTKMVRQLEEMYKSLPG